MNPTRHVLVVGLLAAATSLSLIPASQASQTSPSAVRSHSADRAGYVVTARSLHTLAASWTVPGVWCTSAPSQVVFWAGLSHGSNGVRLGTAVECLHGRATYHGVVSFGKAWSGYGDTIAAGDRMSVSMDWYRGSYELELRDRTSGWFQAESGIGTGDGVRLTRASFVVQARSSGSRSLRLARFGICSFDRLTLDGKPLTAQHPQKRVMRNADGVVRAAPSALAPTGDFKVAWKHS